MTLYHHSPKKRGDSFENFFKSECYRQGFACGRIENGCRTIGKNQLRRVKQMFDFIIAKAGISIMIDTKTTKAHSFGSASIDGNQAKWLYEFEKKDVISGYLINFDELNVTIFFKASDVYNCMLSPRTSLKPENGILIGTNSVLNLKNLLTIQLDRNQSINSEN